MMHLGGLVLFLFFFPGGARRSIRIDDSRDDAQQQDNTLANRLEVSAEAREAYIPGGYMSRIFHRAGPQAGGLHEASQQDNGAPLFRFGQRRAKVSLQNDATRDNTRDASPQTWDNDMSNWSPNKNLVGEYEATDTPDFLPEDGSEQAAMAAGVSFADGMMGSQRDPNRKKSTGPELEGALDSDPDIYVPEQESIVADSSDFVLPEPRWNVKKMAISSTDADYEFRQSSTSEREYAIEVEPVCMTFEVFTCGFTADSHPAFSVTPSSGKMERRNGPPTQLTIKVNPKGASGDLVGYLCFILPDEKDFSSFYKITVQSV